MSAGLQETAPPDTFPAALLAAGLLLPMGSPGLYARSATFERVASAVSELVARAGAPEADLSYRFPPLLARPDFERSDYLRSFPDLIGAVSVFTGDDRAHAALLRDLDDGADWSRGLTASDLALCSAACHPLYGRLDPELPAAGIRADIVGTCFRHEPSADLGRLQSFRQHEQVYVGDADTAVDHRDRWLDRGEAILTGLGLQVHREVANDPFFGRAGRMLAANQRAEVLKYELVAAVGGPGPTTAVLSSNCHLDHFGVTFGLRDAAGEVAHSACVGFGLERITVALFRAHGLDPEQWPAAVTAQLW